MVLLLAFVFACYSGFLLTLLRGWNLALRDEVKVSQGNNYGIVSVIIPVRNEEHTIGKLLSDLHAQRHIDFEVIVVDDHSVDDTTGVVRHFIGPDSNCRLLSSRGFGKKAAISAGINVAKGAIVVTTDADCRVPGEWLSALAQYFNNENVKLVFGTVRMTTGSLFARLQSMEFASLIGSGVAAAALHHPVMCNGANLAFRKSVFEELGGYSGNQHIASGDDEFLMRKVMAAYPRGIRPALDRRSVVTTTPMATINDFVQQRLRWAGKWAANQSLASRLTAIFVFGFQLSTLLLALSVVMNWIDPYPGLILITLKLVLELIFLRKVVRFLDLPWSWTSFVLLQAIYPLYVMLIGILSNFRSFEWKGRKHRSAPVSNKLNKEVAG